MTDDANLLRDQSDWKPEATFNSDTGEVKGSDDQWYKVPQAVLTRWMLLTGFAKVNMDEMRRIVAPFTSEEIEELHRLVVRSCRADDVLCDKLEALRPCP